MAPPPGSLREQLQMTLGTAYRLERELGGGGMSRVFVAEETSLGRKVVVKVLPPDIAAGVSAERFKREIQVAARLQHPHIVPVLSAGEMDGLPYYTMPFVEGESVRARLTRSGAMAIGEAVGILRDVAKALAYAHERGIVHRDIKPDNVLLSGDSATVADFGIAKAIDAARTAAGPRPETLTSIGASLGTPAYMAPEQAAADPSANHRADIYAFGCMAYELLAGRPPFVAKNPQRLLAAQMSDTAEPILSLRPDTPPELAELVTHCLAKDADDRPQSARDVVQVLANVTSGSGHQTMPAVLLAGKGMLKKALAAYIAAFVFVAVLAKAAIVGIGLPDWVFPGAILVMALGLPVILFTAYVHRTTRRMVTQTPTYTPGGSRSSSGTMATIAIKASPHVSWRRTWVGGALAVGAFVAMIAAYMAVRALGIGPFGSLLAAGTLQKHEKLLVADFSSASDSTMSPVITDAFRTALGQSRSVGVFQPNEIRDVLRRMQRPTTTKVDYAVAREIATREGVKAVVLGDVISLGGNYAISVQLVSPQTREELASFRETAKGEGELLPAIDRLAKDMRAKIGESLRQVQATPPLERVTTPSLEALKKYVQGSRIMSFEGDFARGAPLLEEAIQLDTAFAMAYRRLAVEYSNRGQPERAMPLLQKAFDHSDRLSDAERYLVLGSYYQRGPKQDLAKSIAAYETLIELQPDFITALNNVVIDYRWQRNWTRSEEYLRRAIGLGNAPVVVYNQLIWTLMNEGKMDEAWRVLAQYDSIYPQTVQRLGRRAEVLMNAGLYDSAAAVRRHAAELFPNSVEARLGVLYGRMVPARIQGRLREASRAGREATTADSVSGKPEAPLRVASIEAATRVLQANDRAGALAILDAAAKSSRIDSLAPVQPPYVHLAAAEALVGRASEVRALMASFERSRRTIATYEDDVMRAALRGSAAYAEGRYLDAARDFLQSDRGECTVCALPWIARSFDLAGMPDSALAYFEKYFALHDYQRGWTDQLFLAVSHERAGELYESRGDVVNAVAHYTKFVDLWKNADPELQPRVSQVRARIARLKDTERRQ